MAFNNDDRKDGVNRQCGPVIDLDTHADVVAHEIVKSDIDERIDRLLIVEIQLAQQDFEAFGGDFSKYFDFLRVGSAGKRRQDECGHEHPNNTQ